VSALQYDGCAPFHDTDLGEAQWDAFVNESDNATIFHTRRFLSYHPEGRFRDNSLVFYKKGEVLALFPAAVLNTAEGESLVSHPGTSYGGFVYRKNLSIKDAFFLVETLCAYCAKQGYAAVQLTLVPIIYQNHLSQYIDFALVKNGFTYTRREVSSVVQLDTPDAQLLDTYRPDARRAVKKARSAGISVRQSDDYHAFYDILTTNLRMRHNVQPTHTLDELQTLAKLFPERIRLWAAFHDDRLIAGVCNFSANPRVVLAFYISHDQAYQQYRPVNLLFYEIMRQSRAEGFAFLDFGIFTVHMKPNWGLGRFKENFGARGIFRDTLVKHFHS
jgi:hypothetical protein